MTIPVRCIDHESLSYGERSPAKMQVIKFRTLKAEKT